MTTPCTRCGEPVAPDELRCPSCDALAPLPDDHVPTDPTSVDPPPWAIPIREPSSPPERHHVAAPWAGLGRAAGLALLGVVLLTAVVIAGTQALTDDPDDASVTGPTDRAADTDDGSELAGTTDRTSTSTTAAPTTTSSTTSSSTTTSTPPTTAAPTTSSPAPRPPAAGPSAPAGVPRLAGSYDGGWVALLTSVHDFASASRVQAAYDEVRGYAADARLLHSDDWGSLADGFWVLVAPGPFGSADDVRSFCASVDHSRGDCQPRELRR